MWAARVPRSRLERPVALLSPACFARRAMLMRQGQKHCMINGLPNQQGRRMVMKNRLLVAACVSVTLLSGAAIAHHGWGSYDASRTMIVDSSVRRLAWQNPHVQIDVNHAGATWELV